MANQLTFFSASEETKARQVTYWHPILFTGKNRFKQNTDVRECGDAMVTLMLSATSCNGELVMVWGGMSFTETFMSSSVVLLVRHCSCRGFHLLSSLLTLYWNITILEFLHTTKKNNNNSNATIFRFISSIKMLLTHFNVITLCTIIRKEACSHHHACLITCSWSPSS